jgi:hypothetical protein
MTKKATNKKLALTTHTVRDMRDGDLRVAAGGSVIIEHSIDSNCPSKKHSIE